MNFPVKCPACQIETVHPLIFDSSRLMCHDCEFEFEKDGEVLEDALRKHLWAVIRQMREEIDTMKNTVYG